MQTVGEHDAVFGRGALDRLDGKNLKVELVRALLGGLILFLCDRKWSLFYTRVPTCHLFSHPMPPPSHPPPALGAMCGTASLTHPREEVGYPPFAQHALVDVGQEQQVIIFVVEHHPAPRGGGEVGG